MFGAKIGIAFDRAPPVGFQCRLGDDYGGGNFPLLCDGSCSLGNLFIKASTYFSPAIISRYPDRVTTLDHLRIVEHLGGKFVDWTSGSFPARRRRADTSAAAQAAVLNCSGIALGFSLGYPQCSMRSWLIILGNSHIICWKSHTNTAACSGPGI